MNKLKNDTPVTNIFIGKRKEKLILDLEDHNAYSKMAFSVIYDPDKVSNPRARVYLNKKWRFLSRLIIKAKRGQIVDHINRNTLDNRKENLRFVTRNENVRNSRMYSTNKSGYKGVSWDKRKNKYQAITYINRKLIRLGFFDDPKIASERYREFIKDNFGGKFPNIQYEKTI